jgi:hypothetical protein
VKQATIEQIFNMFAEGKVNPCEFDQQEPQDLGINNDLPSPQNAIVQSGLFSTPILQKNIALELEEGLL